MRRTLTFINVKFEQDLLRCTRYYRFPSLFYSPAILKEWQDLVLEYGFAYIMKEQFCVARSCSFITTGGGEQATA